MSILHKIIKCDGLIRAWEVLNYFHVMKESHCINVYEHQDITAFVDVIEALMKTNGLSLFEATHIICALTEYQPALRDQNFTKLHMLREQLVGYCSKHPERVTLVWGGINTPETRMIRGHYLAFCLHPQAFWLSTDGLKLSDVLDPMLSLAQGNMIVYNLICCWIKGCC